MAKAKQTPGLALRLVAAERLAAVLRGASFAPLTAAELPEPRDRAVANRLVTTALRHLGPLRRLCETLLVRGMPKKSGLFEPVLLLSLAQLLVLPELGAHSALFLAGEAMRADPKSQHLVKLMNGVLRTAQRQPAAVSVEADALFPPHLLVGWRAMYGVDAVEAFGRALLEGAPLDVTLKADDPGLGGSPVLADTVRIVERDRAVEQLPGYADGRFWVQDAAAAIPARLMGLPTGARVLDVGAAPGGKTAQLAKAGYEVTALERDPARIERLRANLGRLGYVAAIVTADALDYVPEHGFDGVLLDAPCSATGIFRRHPEVVWHRDAADIAGRVAVQRQLIGRATICLNPGGVLLYCVCSLQPEEGESQAEWALSQGLEPWPITAAELGWAVPVTAAGFVRTHPGQTVPGEKGGTLDGFFVARFRRR
ncbi:MAG TPA: RsmB/NOP family class I SAM-dependent RNA methyltransferase [Devosia sp.]|nr:RsmB/NOP family class I SAM-dependent RNA methyltransferase [Devosia sp.]